MQHGQPPIAYNPKPKQWGIPDTNDITAGAGTYRSATTAWAHHNVPNWNADTLMTISYRPQQMLRNRGNN